MSTHKNIIFYFSGTGNSLVVARDLASLLENTELVSIEKVISNPSDISSIERIGFIHPVYMLGIPPIVRNFIEKLTIPNNTYIFAGVTSGGMDGNVFKHISQILKQKGCALSYGFSIHMPDNYIPFWSPGKENKWQELFAKEKEMIKQKAADIKSDNNGYPKSSILSFGYEIFYKLSTKHIHKMDKKFWVDENCNSCGICEKICPVQNIKLEDQKPCWQHKCEHCLRCLHLCPQSAIQFGKSTVNRKRYHHPEVTLQDF